MQSITDTSVSWEPGVYQFYRENRGFTPRAARTENVKVWIGSTFSLGSKYVIYANGSPKNTPKHRSPVVAGPVVCEDASTYGVIPGRFRGELDRRVKQGGFNLVIET